MSGAGTANVTPHNVTQKPLPQDHSIDFLLTMDFLHDMAHPDTVATVIGAAIRPGGLAPTKAPRLQQLLAEVRERCPDYDLGELSELPLNEAKAWLRSLPGVGPDVGLL